MSEEAVGETVTLSRISVKIDNSEVRLTEDTFDAESKALIFKIKEPEKMPGYKLKYVMRNKLSKITARPQDKSKPTSFDCYAVYQDESERLPLLTQLADDIEEKLKGFQVLVNNSIANIVKFKREKLPSSE